jgi:hypothetical protein
MGTLRKGFLATALLLAISGTAAADNFWVGVRAGTTGIGLEGIWRPIDWVDVRLGVRCRMHDPFVLQLSRIPSARQRAWEISYGFIAIRIIALVSSG